MPTRRKLPKHAESCFAAVSPPTKHGASRIKRYRTSSARSILARIAGRCSGEALGVTRKGRLTDAEATRYVNVLQNDRKYADYGHGTAPEPYDVPTVDERLAWAIRLVEDLKTLI